MKTSQIFFILLVTIFFSCEEKSTNLYPKLYKNRSDESGKVRVFTKGKEITDQSIINNVFKKHPVGETPQQKLDNSIILRYTSPEKVLISTTDDYIEERNVIKLNGIEYLEAMDTVSVNLEPGERFNAFCKYFPLYRKIVSVGIDHGYKTKIDYKNCFFVKNESNKIVIPYFEYRLFNKFSDLHIKVNNEFDIKSINSINEGDTLIIKNSNLILN